MTEIVKARRLHFLSGRDKNGSLVSVSSVLAAANEIIKIAPSGFKDFNTELVVKIDQYPNRKKLPTNVLESERYRLRTVVYNRLDLEKILAVEFKQDESSAFKIEFPETVTHPLSMEQLGVLLSRWHGYDIIDADAILTHVRDNQYTITAKPNSLGYTGIATINAGDFVTVEPGEPEVPVEGTPTESFFFTNSEEVVDLNVNGIVVPINELYQRYGVSVSVWPDDGRKVFGLVNTSTNTLQVTLPETALVSDYNVNESLVTQTDGTRTFKLSPMIGVVEKPTPSEEILDDTDLTFSVNVTDPNALGKLIECWVDGEKITFAASFENEKIKIYRNSEGDLVVSNLAYEATSVIVVVKTASLGHGEDVLFGSGVSVEIVDGYEVISFNLAAAAPPVEDPVPSNITLGSIKGSTVYSSLVALAGTDLLNEDELEEAVITVGGEGTEVKVLTINIKPYTEKGLLAIPFNIAANDWAKVNALPADTVVGECTVLFNGDVITAPLTAGGLSRMGINNPDEDSYTFTLSADVPFVGSIIFNLDFDTGSSNRYLPTTTTFEINVLNYVENWIKPEVLSPAELKQFYGVDDVEFENDVSVVNWLTVGGGVNGDDLFYNTELVYDDRRGELPTGPLFFSLNDAAKNYIAKPKESGQVLFTIDVDGTSTEVTVSDLNIVTLTNGDVEKHCFRIDVTADQIKALKVIKVTGDLDGPLNAEELTGGLFGNSTHTFSYNVTVTPLPAIPSPVSVSPATEELVNFVIDRMNNEGIDVTDRALFGQYEETVEQNDSYWTVTQLHPYAPGVKQVSIFVTFPKEVLDKLEIIPEDTVVFRAISDVEELAEALSFTALDVISQMFELGDSVYLPINHTVGTGVLRETTVWGVDFDGLENFYSESAFTLDILAEMEPAPSASVVNLLDISGTDIEHNYALTDYSTFNGKDTLEYRVKQLGHGLDIHVPFSIPVEARNLLENSTVPEETRIVAKVNGNVVQTYTVEQISNWGSLVLDIANSHFTYNVPEEEAVHKNQDVTYDITFESDFDGTGRVYSQYTSEHSVVVSYEYDSQLCPVVPVIVTDKVLYDQIKAKNPEMSTLDFEEFIKHEVAINGLDVKIHVKEDVGYYQLPLFYKADSTFGYANVYPTVDTIIAQVDSEPLTAGTALTKVVEVDGEYYFVKMVEIGSTGNFHIIADWDGEEYSYCKQTTTSIPYTVYKYQISLYELPSVSVEKAVHTSQVNSIQPYLITSEGNANILTRDFVVDTVDKGKNITLVYKVPTTMAAYLATLPEDTVVLRLSDSDNGSLLDGTRTAGDLAQSIRVQDGEHYMFFAVDTTNVATTIDVQMNVDWDGEGFVYREDSYRLINNFDWITPIVSELIPVDPNSPEFEDVLIDKLGDGYRKALHIDFAIDNVGNITRHDILNGYIEGSQTIYHMFTVPFDSKAVLEAAADNEVVITIDGVGYSKYTLFKILHVFEDNLYLVLEHTPELSETITSQTLEITQDWDGEGPYYIEGSTVLEHSSEFFTQSASTMEPFNSGVGTAYEDLFDFVGKLNASGLIIPETISYTGTETVLEHTFDSYGDAANYVFPMVIPNDVFAAIQSVAAEGGDQVIIYSEDESLSYTAEQIVDLVITVNGVHYFPFIAPVVSENDADNVTSIVFYFDADGHGYEYGDTLNTITISLIHEYPLPEPEVKITTFGRSIVLEGTYTPGYILEVYSTENGVRSELNVTKNEYEGTWTVIDYSQLDGIDYFIEAQLLDPDSRNLLVEDSLIANNELEDPLGDPTTMPRILCEGATNEFYIRSNLDFNPPMISVNDGPWLSQDELINGENQVAGLDISYQLANPGAVMRFTSNGSDPLHIRFNVSNSYGTWGLFNDGTGDGGVNDLAQDNSAFVMYDALGNVIDHTDPGNFDYNSGVAQLPTSETDYVVHFSRIDFCLNPTEEVGENIPDSNFTKVTYIKTDTSNPMWIEAEYAPENVNGKLHIDWGDGAKEVLNIADFEADEYYLYLEHEYAVNGEYIVKVYSTTKVNYTGFGEITKVIDWGSPTNLQPLYFSSDNLIEVPSILHPAISNLESMFSGSTNFNQDISMWNTSNVTNMEGMFEGAKSFDQDISNWNVSNVTNMGRMFHAAINFNKPIGSWDVSNITSMNLIFAGTEAFNQPLNNWNTGNVTSMYGVFEGAKAFDQDISNWNVSNVTNMNNMFRDAVSFNQDLSQWCVSQIPNTPDTFDIGATNWSLPRPVWGTCPQGGGNDGDDIANDEMYFTTTAGSLYYQGKLGDVITLSDGTTHTVSEDGSYSNENVPAGKHKVKLVTERSDGYVGIDGEALIELHNFPTLSAVTNFDFCPNSNSPNLVKVPDFLPSNLTKTTSMFVSATSFNQDISGWDTSNVTDMKYMFEDATSFNQDLSQWNVSNVTNMGSMFYEATAFDQDLSQWCVGLITSLPDYFATGATLFTSDKHPVWGTCPQGENVPIPSTVEPMLVTPSTSTISISSTSDLEIDWGDGTVQTVKTGDDTALEHFGLISKKYTHTYADSYDDKTISVKHADGASPIQFFSSDAIKEVQQWYSEGYQPFELLNEAVNFRQDITFAGLGSQLETVPNITPPSTTNLSGLFQNATSFNQDISGWDVSNVTSLTYIFAYASAFNQDISGWDTSNVVDMYSTFNGATSFNQDISGWNVSNVTNMKGMFFIASSFNQDISDWDVSNVVDMSMMFYEATAFDQDLSQWCVGLITSLPDYFADGATLFTSDKHPIWGTCPRGEASPTSITIEYDDKSEIPLRGTFTPLDADEIELSYYAGGATEYIVVEMDNESGTYTVPAFVRDIALGYAFEAKLKRNNEVLAENSYFLSALLA